MLLVENNMFVLYNLSLTCAFQVLDSGAEAVFSEVIKKFKVKLVIIFQRKQKQRHSNFSRSPLEVLQNS